MPIWNDPSVERPVTDNVDDNVIASALMVPVNVGDAESTLLPDPVEVVVPVPPTVDEITDPDQTPVVIVPNVVIDVWPT